MQIFKIKTADIICEAVKKIFGSELSKDQIVDMLEYPPDQTMGDVALPCFKLSKTLKKSPVMIADALCGSIADPMFEKVDSLSGYLNFTASASFLKDALSDILAEGDKFGSSKLGKGKTVVLYIF